MSLNRRKVLLVLVVLAAVIQLIPVNRDNPPVTATLAAPPELLAILRRSCFDCHSNETIWPWYSRIAPVSWLVAHDVHEGREHLNFSTWGDSSGEKQAKLRKEIRETVREGEMPPFQYYPAHPEARLSEQDKAAILAWAQAP
jgi:Haem-binding domain